MKITVFEPGFEHVIEYEWSKTGAKTVSRAWATYLPTLPYPRLGARGSGLGAGAGLILDYRKIIFATVVRRPQVC